MNALELHAAIQAVGYSLSCQLGNKDIATWGIIFSQLGTTLSSIAALNELQSGGEEDGVLDSTEISDDAAAIASIL